MEQTKPIETSQKPSTAQAMPSVHVNDNIAYIKEQLQSPGDLMIRPFVTAEGEPAAVVCIDGLVDKQLIQDKVLQPLLEYKGKPNNADVAELGLQGGMPPFASERLPIQEVQSSADWDEIVLAILSGDAALFIEGTAGAAIIGSKGGKSRAIEEPQTESLIRGPRDGFTEDLRTNTALIRRRIKDPHLRFESFRIGRRARTDVVLVYLEGIANPLLVEEVKRRIATIDVDDPAGSGSIEQWITDRYWSPFPQILNTERPDKVTGGIMQGRVALLVDGTPFQLVMPITLSSFIQSPEDYYQSWVLATILRVLRVLCAFTALFLPGIYIALVEYHHGMLPSKLAFSIAGSREGVPFPAVVETFLMEGTLEVLREAGVRLPKPIGQTIGVVGGLVIGESAVAAGLVSPVMVIVVAVTAIASFAIPSYGFAISIRMLRFGIMIAGSMFGLYGVVLALIMNCVHIANLKSFGVPYTAPWAPLRPSDWRDFIFRMPVMRLNRRPDILESMNAERINLGKGKGGESS